MQTKIWLDDDAGATAGIALIDDADAIEALLSVSCRELHSDSGRVDQVAVPGPGEPTRNRLTR